MDLLLLKIWLKMLNENLKLMCVCEFYVSVSAHVPQCKFGGQKTHNWSWCSLSTMEVLGAEPKLTYLEASASRWAISLILSENLNYDLYHPLSQGNSEQLFFTIFMIFIISKFPIILNINYYVSCSSIFPKYSLEKYSSHWVITYKI